MDKKANKRILGMTQTELLILITMSGLLLCGIVIFGGYVIYGLNHSIPVAIPPTSIPTLLTQRSIRLNNTSTLVPKATATPKATARPTFTEIPTATLFVIPTISIPTVTTAPTTTATTVATPESIVNPSQCETTISEKYRVIFKYPANWGCDVIGDNAFGFSRPEGFIEITSRVASKTAKEFCDTQIKDSHGLNSFGKNPTLTILQIDNQPACLVLPSSDQASKYRKASLLVVSYPQSIMEHTLLLISADKYHIGGYIRSLQFVR